MPNRRVSNIPMATAGNQLHALQVVIEVLSSVTGQSKLLIQPLAPDASMADVVAKVNEILSRLQGTA